MFGIECGGIMMVAVLDAHVQVCILLRGLSHKMEEAYDINTATDLYNIVKIGLNEVKQ